MGRSVFRRSTNTVLKSAGSTWRDVGPASPHGGQVRIADQQREKSRVLDEAYDEYCRLRESGNSVAASDFCLRYPTYRKSLRRLIDVHEDLWDCPALQEEVWPEVGDAFLGFEILHKLGVGAIARVYLASEPLLGGRLVAVKVALSGGDEAETLGRLSHPNIVPVHSVQHDDQTHMTAVCMPYLGSTTLLDLLEVAFADGQPPDQANVVLHTARAREQVLDFAHGEASPEAADEVLAKGTYVDGVVHLGVQLADALAYTHARGILHGDLKPSNVLLTASGRPMLLDFNLSTPIAPDSRRVGGTLPYMPPEQIREAFRGPDETPWPVDPRSDVFALGVILYELLSGRLPFGAPPEDTSSREAGLAYSRAQQQPPPRLRRLNPQVDRGLAKTIHRCLELDAAKRPASAAQLAAELRRQFSPAKQLVRWTKRNRLAVGLAATLLTISLSLFAWHIATRPPYPVRQYTSGLAALERGRWEQAIEYFDRSLKDEPQSVRTLVAKGYAYQQLGKYNIAFDFLNQAVVQLGLLDGKAPDPSDNIVLECLAYSSFRTNKPGPAVHYYRKTIERDPNSPALYVNLAFSYSRLEKKADSLAEKALDKAIELAPGFQLAYHLRSRIRGQRGAIERAVEDIEQALECGPSYALLQFDAARTFAVASRDNPALLSRMTRHLQAAAEAGAPRSWFDGVSNFDPWKDERWFVEVLEPCGSGANSAQGGDLSDLFLTPPNPHEVQHWLKT